MKGEKGRELAVIGGTSGVRSIILCTPYIFFNPHSLYTGITETDVIIFFILFLPACLAIFAAFARQRRWMLIAFFWALPYSTYVYFTPSIFYPVRGYLFSLSAWFSADDLEQTRSLKAQRFVRKSFKK